MEEFDINLMEPKGRVKNVIDEGFILNFSESVPVRRYYRTLNEMYRMACVYFEEGSLEASLKLFTRFSCLLLNYLPKHPDFNADGLTEKEKAKAKLHNAISNAEKIKKKLLLVYEVEEKAFRKEQEDRLAALAKRREEEEKFEPHPPSYFPSDGAPIPPSTELNFPTDGGFVPSAGGLDFPEFNGAKLQPSAPAISELEDDANFVPLVPEVPPRDAKPGYPSVSGEIKSDALPTVDRSQKPTGDRFVVEGLSYIPQNRYGLRSVVIPRMLVQQFLSLAEPNTSGNVETCGILGGQLAQNKFRVTHLIVPKQSGTPDSCNTEKEELVFDYQDKHDLITVGWIHTHPTQTAFLSSVDLHTHCSYQLMLPEAVAVVCSPKYQETGIFMLNPDSGLQEIASCTETGFHPHRQTPPLFEQCPHAVIADGFQATVVDFR